MTGSQLLMLGEIYKRINFIGIQKNQVKWMNKKGHKSFPGPQKPFLKWKNEEKCQEPILMTKLPFEAITIRKFSKKTILLTKELKHVYLTPYKLT